MNAKKRAQIVVWDGGARFSFGIHAKVVTSLRGYLRATGPSFMIYDQIGPWGLHSGAR